jgi:predicted nucleotidyltransferase
MLDMFVETVHARFGDAVDRIVLFGSRARGDADSASDIDVLVTISGDRHALGRLRRGLRDLATEAELAHVDRVSAPLSLVVLQKEDLAELVRRERRFALDVEAEGIPL